MVRNKTEAAIKEILVSHLQKIEKQEPAFIYEMNIARFSCRADIIVANGHLSVYEIKSASDNLERLPKQLETYKHYFEKVVVVCASEHLEGVQELVEPETGVWSIDAQGKLKKHKRGRLTTISKESWLTFLPVDLLRNLLRDYGLRSTGDRKALVCIALDKLTMKEIREYVLEYMKVRHLRIDRMRQAREESIRIRKEFETKINEVSEWLQRIPEVETLKAIPRKAD